MKRNHLLTTGALCLALAAASCCRQAPAPQAKASAEPVSLKDHGAEPTVLNIESHTLANENFRTALWTGHNLQVTLMAIPAGGDVGLEQHHDIDQFLRVEEGTARTTSTSCARSRTTMRSWSRPENGTTSSTQVTNR